ncbi:MAG: phosphate signaling complex protein PhoU [Rhodospirillales bacterium]
MAQEHTVKSFDEELNRLENVLVEMGGMAEVQLADAIDALAKRDEEKAAKVVANDKRIDELEREVDSLAIRLLALRQPMADDLRSVVTALKTASIVERIGDYAKNVAKRTAVISQKPPAGTIQSIARMGAMVQGMIKDVLDAYVTRDVAKANDVLQIDERVDLLYTSLFREFLTYMMEDPRNITPCTHLLFVAKILERIGDHATNIAENVHFLVSGELPEEERPKGQQSIYEVEPS